MLKDRRLGTTTILFTQNHVWLGNDGFGECKTAAPEGAAAVHDVSRFMSTQRSAPPCYVGIYHFIITRLISTKIIVTTKDINPIN